MANQAGTGSKKKTAREEKELRIEAGFIRDIKRYREVRDLADRLYTENGCVFKNDYTLKRFRQSVVWYIKKAKKMKLWFFVLSILSIVLPTVATVLNSVDLQQDWVRYLVSGISSLTAFIAALTGLIKFQSKWIQYRSTAEELQSELTLFILSANEYGRCSLEKKHSESCMKDQKFTNETFEKMKEELFAINMERVMAKEKSRWYSLNKPNSE